jgi:hypothetical protein
MMPQPYSPSAGPSALGGMHAGMPCARCGAPMSEDNAQQISATHVMLGCAFCGTRESLPNEPNQKLIALRTLNAQRRWAEDAIRGPALTLLRWRDGGTLMTYVGSYGFLLAMVAATFASQGQALLPILRLALEDTPTGNAARESLAMQMGSVGGVLGVSIATIAAVFWTAATVRREIGPYASARPPAYPGRPVRCRRCGAELVLGASGVVACGFCRADNFVHDASAHAHVAELANVVRQAQQLAVSSKVQMDRVNARVRARLMLAFFLGGPIGAVVAGVATFVLLRM